MNDHAKIMDKYMRDLVTVAQKTCFYSATHVPHGTRIFTGQAQASTKMAIGAPNLDVVLSSSPNVPRSVPDPIGQAVRRFKTVSKQIRLGDIVYISNNLPYIRILEFGYGDLMFHKAASLWQEDVNRAVNDVK